jgi:hypothetical protein
MSGFVRRKGRERWHHRLNKDSPFFPSFLSNAPGTGRALPVSFTGTSTSYQSNWLIQAKYFEQDLLFCEAKAISDLTVPMLPKGKANI